MCTDEDIDFALCEPIHDGVPICFCGLRKRLTDFDGERILGEPLADSVRKCCSASTVVGTRIGDLFAVVDRFERRRG